MADKTEPEATEPEAEQKADESVALCLWCSRDQATVEWCQRCGFKAPE